MRKFPDIGNRIKLLRQEKGITRQQLADVLGITYNVFANYENNIRNPNYLSFKQLSEYFEVSVDYLLSNQAGAFEIIDSHRQNQIYQILQRCNNLSNEDLRFLIKLIERIAKQLSKPSLQAFLFVKVS